MVPGDWVNSYSKGIWQIYRILPVAYEMRYSLADRRKKSKRVIVFSRRIVNSKWRRAFETECCEQSLVTALSPSDRRRLDELLSSDGKLRAAFDLYAPKPMHLIGNLSMSIPEVRTLESFCTDTLAPAMTSGISMDDVLILLEKANLAQFVGKYPINATLQLVCRDHEVRDGEFVLRDCRVLPF